jgi:hypothetical protein
VPSVPSVRGHALGGLGRSGSLGGHHGLGQRGDLTRLVHVHHGEALAEQVHEDGGVGQLGDATGHDLARGERVGLGPAAIEVAQEGHVRRLLRVVHLGLLLLATATLALPAALGSFATLCGLTGLGPVVVVVVAVLVVAVVIGVAVLTRVVAAGGGLLRRRRVSRAGIGARGRRCAAGVLDHVIIGGRGGVVGVDVAHGGTSQRAACAAPGGLVSGGARLRTGEWSARLRVKSGRDSSPRMKSPQLRMSTDPRTRNPPGSSQCASSAGGPGSACRHGRD